MTARSAQNSTRRRALRPVHIDGLTIRLVDDPAAPAVDLGHALRLLARLMVRAHQHASDHEAIIPVSTTSSTLTVLAAPSPDHDTNNEAA